MIGTVNYRVTTPSGDVVEYTGYLGEDGFLRVDPCQGPQKVSHTGEQYYWDELPPPEYLPEGTYCMTCNSINGVWHTSGHEVRGREWVRVSTTIPPEVDEG